MHFFKKRTKTKRKYPILKWYYINRLITQSHVWNSNHPNIDIFQNSKNNQKRYFHKKKNHQKKAKR